MDAVFYGDELMGNIKQSSVPVEQIILFNILMVVFAGIGAISIYFAYSMFIDNRKKDIGTLIGLGMSKKQLNKLLFTELFIVYIISFFTALILSNIAMYIIIQNYLYVENKNLVLIAYRFSFSRSSLLLFISFLAMLSSFIISLEKISNISVIQTIQSEAVGKKIKRDTNIWDKSSAVKYIGKANLIRNKKIFIICSILSVPVMIINIVFLNYMNLLNTPIDEPDFIIDVNYIEIYNYSEIILESVDYLKNIEGIKNIEFFSYNNNFLMEINELKLKFPASAVCDHGLGGLGYYHHASINVLEDQYFQNIENYNQKNHVILSENLDSSEYIEGDKLFLNDHSKHDGNNNKKTFTVAGFIDLPQTGVFLNIFVTSENFEQMTGYPAIPNAINIYTDNPVYTEQIRDEIFSIFDNENLFKILDNAKRTEDRAALEKGLMVAAFFLCAAIFVCVIVLLWSFISFYISNQKQQINTLRIIGATKKDIIKIAVNESLARGMINASIGFALGTYISHILIRANGYAFLINNYMLVLCVLIIAATILAHFIPAVAAIKKIVTDEEDNYGNT
jgi:ABC-type lipoprotein release transport system permease subunit